MGFLLFICITIFLLIRLNNIIGMDIGFKVDIKHDRRFNNKDDEANKEESTIEEIHHHNNNIDKDGNSFYNSKSRANFVPYDFADRAKQAFEIIFVAYASGDKRTLKGLLAPKLFHAFSMAIDDRESRGEKLEGILVRFIKADVVDSYVSDNGDDMFITVKFVTEQSNVLKDRNGIVLEGNSDFVEHREDTWIFNRKKSAVSATWFLYEISDE